MATVYATYEQYANSTGDEDSAPERVEQVLEELSAALRAECALRDGGALEGDAGLIARSLVIDAARKALVRPSIDGFAGDMEGARQASFTANGFTQSVTLTTTGARFDAASLARFKRLVGRGQRVRMVYPYGWG